MANAKIRLSMSNPVRRANSKRLGGLQYSGTKIGLVRPSSAVPTLERQTTARSLMNARVPPAGPDLRRDYARGKDYLAGDWLYRATIMWSVANTDVRIGRQHLALGTGQFWSPLDLLNPIDPTRLERDSGRESTRHSVERKHGFANTLNLTVDLYINGQGTNDRARYDFASLYAGRVISVARRYVAIATSYQITPLFKTAVYGIMNADDRSVVLWPRLEYSVAANLDVAAGLERFAGGQATEYGRFSNVLHVEARRYF